MARRKRAVPHKRSEPCLVQSHVFMPCTMEPIIEIRKTMPTLPCPLDCSCVDIIS